MELTRYYVDFAKTAQSVVKIIASLNVGYSTWKFAQYNCNRLQVYVNGGNAFSWAVWLNWKSTFKISYDLLSNILLLYKQAFTKSYEICEIARSINLIH